jgi:hypothetical protein
MAEGNIVERRCHRLLCHRCGEEALNEGEEKEGAFFHLSDVFVRRWRNSSFLAVLLPKEEWEVTRESIQRNTTQFFLSTFIQVCTLYFPCEKEENVLHYHRIMRILWEGSGSQTAVRHCGFSGDW